MNEQKPDFAHEVVFTCKLMGVSEGYALYMVKHGDNYVGKICLKKTNGNLQLVARDEFEEETV